MDNLRSDRRLVENDSFNTSQQLPIVPYHRANDQKSIPNIFTQLPLEMQLLLYTTIIGRANGSVILEDYLKCTSCGSLHQPNETASSLDAPCSALPQRKTRLTYRLPTSASPQIMLVSYGIYEIANPLYRKICRTTVKASPRDLCRLSTIIPDFSPESLRSVIMVRDNDETGETRRFVYEFLGSRRKHPNLISMSMNQKEWYNKVQFGQRASEAIDIRHQTYTK